MASSSSNSAQKKPSVVTLFELGVNFYICVDSHMLRIEPSWQWEDQYDELDNAKQVFVIDALDLIDRDGINKGYITRLTKTKEICYVLMNKGRQIMVTTTFKHDKESKVLLDEVALSSFGI